MNETNPQNADERKTALFLQQKELLQTLLSHNAITPAQYEKSYGDLKKLMRVSDDGTPLSE